MTGCYMKRNAGLKWVKGHWMLRLPPMEKSSDAHVMYQKQPFPDIFQNGVLQNFAKFQDSLIKLHASC